MRPPAVLARRNVDKTVTYSQARLGRARRGPRGRGAGRWGPRQRPSRGVGRSPTLSGRLPTSGARPSTRPLTSCAAGRFTPRRPTTIGRRTPRPSRLFLLRHVEGLSIEELAGVFQLEKNNVAVRIHRIRLRLQTEMER